jgi:hypothetical protein
MTKETVRFTTKERGLVIGDMTKEIAITAGYSNSTKEIGIVQSAI